MDMLFFLQDPPTPPAPPTGGAAGGIAQMLPMFGLMFVVMYFLMIRPQNKQRKERDGMIANLKKNDHVITSFGLHGIVKQSRPEDKDILLCIDEAKDVRVRVSKASIAGIEKAAGGGESEPKPEPQEKARS